MLLSGAGNSYKLSNESSLLSGGTTHNETKHNLSAQRAFLFCPDFYPCYSAPRLSHDENRLGRFRHVPDAPRFLLPGHIYRRTILCKTCTVQALSLGNPVWHSIFCPVCPCYLFYFQQRYPVIRPCYDLFAYRSRWRMRRRNVKLSGRNCNNKVRRTCIPQVRQLYFKILSFP